MIKKVFSLFCILIFAFLLRFSHAGENSIFYYDESYDALQARRMITDKKITLLGHPYSLSGTYQGPLYYYLSAPWLFFANYNPEAIVYFIITVNLAALMAIYFFTHKFFGSRTAFFTSLLFALSPKLVELSQKSWYPGSIELFSPAAFFLLVYLKNINRKLFVLLSGLFVGFMMQLHIMSFPFVVFAVVYLFFTKRKLEILVFMAGVVFGVLPMILFELRHDFFNVKMFLKYINSNSGAVVYPIYFDRLLSNLKLLIKGYFGENTNNFILIFASILSVAGSVQLYLHNKNIAKTIIAFFLVGIFCVSIFKGEMTFHYLTFLHFVPLIFMGFIFARFSQNKIFRIILTACFCIVTFFYISGKFYVTPEWTIHQSREAGKLIAKDVRPKDDFNVVLLVHGESRAWPLRYFLDVYGKKPLGVDDYGRSKIIYVVSNNLKLVKSINLWELRAGGPSNVLKIWKLDSGYALYKLEYFKIL